MDKNAFALHCTKFYIYCLGSRHFDFFLHLIFLRHQSGTGPLLSVGLVVENFIPLRSEAARYHVQFRPVWTYLAKKTSKVRARVCTARNLLFSFRVEVGKDGTEHVRNKLMQGFEPTRERVVGSCMTLSKFCPQIVRQCNRALTCGFYSGLSSDRISLGCIGPLTLSGLELSLWGTNSARGTAIRVAWRGGGRMVFSPVPKAAKNGQTNMQRGEIQNSRAFF